MAATTSASRIEANRRNAQKATGPRTAEGKARSRFNALKHGFRARVEVLPGEDPAAYQARLGDWMAHLEPRDPVERYLVERAVQVSWQLDRADRAQAARLADSRYAGVDRTADEVDEVELLGRRLFWDPRGPVALYPHSPLSFRGPIRISWSEDLDDPNDPARVVNLLEASALGCAWLLDRWAALREVLDDGLCWQAPDRFKAIRMLGRQPIDAADDDRVLMIYRACLAMEPDAPDPMADVAPELSESERVRFNARLMGRAPASPTLETPEEGRAALLGLIADEEARLEAVLAVHLAREDATAAERLGFDDSEQGERLRRYQAAGNRTLLRIIETLRKRHRDADRDPAPGRRPADPPTNEPNAPAPSATADPPPADPVEPGAPPDLASSPPVRRGSPDPAAHGPVRRGSPDPAAGPTEGLPDPTGPDRPGRPSVPPGAGSETRAQRTRAVPPRAGSETRAQRTGAGSGDSRPAEDRERVDRPAMDGPSTPNADDPGAARSATNEPNDPAGPHGWPDLLARALASLGAVWLLAILAAIAAAGPATAPDRPRAARPHAFLLPRGSTCDDPGMIVSGDVDPSRRPGRSGLLRGENQRG